MNKLYTLWVNHGTKVIGFAQGTIAAVAAIDGIIPPAHLKYYLGVSAVLTFWRGYFNSSRAS
jgi:hypothetical protein